MMKDAAKTASWLDLANPTRFLAFAGRVVPWLGLASAIFLAVGLYMVFLSPDDYQQGSTVRIMYIHVPFAWLSMMCYSIMAVSSLGTLVWRHPLADVSVRAAAPIGAVFTALALATGSLWGKPMWEHGGYGMRGSPRFLSSFSCISALLRSRAPWMTRQEAQSP